MMSMRPHAALLVSCLYLLAGCATAPTPPAAAPAGARSDSAPQSPEPQALKSAANTAYGARQYAQCAQLYLEQAAAEPPTRKSRILDAYYNAVCCQALAGSKDEAFKTLERMAQEGARSADWMQQDEDFASLRSDPRWSASMARLQANHEAWLKTLHPELYQLHDEDQDDRRKRPIDWSVVGPRDAQRRARVDALLAQGAARVSDDFFHAALVFQHGDTAEDLGRAHELAMKAVELDPANDGARWLAAASKDRHLHRLGKPQIYGTQFRRASADEPWTLEPLDPHAVDDAERARWNVPPLAQAYESLKRMNEALEKQKTQQ